jgi:hypothetical protein
MAGTEHVKSVMVEEKSRKWGTEVPLSVPMWGSSMWGFERNVLLQVRHLAQRVFGSCLLLERYGASGNACTCVTRNMVLSHFTACSTSSLTDWHANQHFKYYSLTTDSIC